MKIENIQRKYEEEALFINEIYQLFDCLNSFQVKRKLQKTGLFNFGRATSLGEGKLNLISIYFV